MKSGSVAKVMTLLGMLIIGSTTFSSLAPLAAQEVDSENSTSAGENQPQLQVPKVTSGEVPDENLGADGEPLEENTSTGALDGAEPTAPPAGDTVPGSSDALPTAPNGVEIVTAIAVKGNAKVEGDAIISLLETSRGDPFRPKVVSEDIRTLFDLGYFSDIRVFKQSAPGGIELIFEVVEKPAIVAIELSGNEEISKDDIRDKLETKVFTIVNEATITSDVRMIEQQYAQKGFYLARVTYTLENEGPSETKLTFHIDEGGKVRVGSVDILGNKYFSDSEIINGTPGLASRPLTRSSSFSSASLYQENFVKRDLEYIAYIYRDQGFAEVKVAKPIQVLDPDRRFVRLTFQVEEGRQYRVGSIKVSGDVLFPETELKEAMLLKEGELFRYSQFTQDVEQLVDKYGDLGYAYADVNPKTRFDQEKKLVHLDYTVSKGQKVYFGPMTIVGNTKTRDNVIRREFEVADSELYSGTRLAETRQNINRLGYFEEVQIIKQRNEQQANLLNLKVQVKEKATGQLQAALGFTPSSSGTEGSRWFGQGRYEEKNQSGRGWNTNLTGKWNGEDNYNIEAGFADPRLNDSEWSAGVGASYSNEKRTHLADISITEQKIGGSVFLGREIIELLRGRLTYRLQNIKQESDAFLLRRFQEDGLSSSLIFSLIRNSVDNYIDPTEGSEFTVQQTFTGGMLGGDHQYMESTFDGTYYYPVDYTDTFRTYFKLHGVLSYIYPMGEEPIPFSERYRLGGYNDLRGFKYWEIGPRFSLLRSPGGRRTSINKGGDKKLFTQLEYFIPLIPEAGIKALLFADVGRVYDDSESLSFSDFNKDIGFGFRWITPIAPFRFEWAYPVEDDGSLGDMEIIFYIGY